MDKIKFSKEKLKMLTYNEDWVRVWWEAQNQNSLD